MKHTKEEIIKALHVIKDTCCERYEERGSCYNCPFSDSYSHCVLVLNEKSPMCWDIKDDEPWRAFE